MRLALLLFIAQIVQVRAFAGIDVVYGKDNRKDVYEVQNSLFLELAKSTAGMIPIGQLKLASNEIHLELNRAPSLKEGQNVCATEAFASQPIAPSCSGFLVGPDTLITAGHCYKSFSTPENVCKDFLWVFGYEMKSATHNPTKGILYDDIYLCKEVIAAELDNNYDFAIIKLDRNVIGRKPLAFRNSGKISENTPLVVIGHPSGLPTKISDGGRVTKNSEFTRFSTTLDTFHGNSGSAVFDARTGIIEGILIQGKNDYRPSLKNNPNSCLVVNICDEDAKNCSAGEDFGLVKNGEVVLRIGAFQKQLNEALKN
jgi:V8-like Glu-specific endopeptidase